VLKTLPLAALAALSGSVPAAMAQEQQDTLPPDTVYIIEEIAVKVARPVATAGGASALTVPLDSIRATPAPTLADILRRMPLIMVRENSRGEAQPQLRGMESRRIAVLVDGVPLTLGWDNRTDLSVIPLTAARELTVVRGLSSVLYGPNALGGVVLIGLGEGPGIPVEPQPFQLAAGVDQLGNSAIALGLTTVTRAGGGDLLLRAGGGYRNRSAWPRPPKIPPPFSGAGDDRVNSDFEQLNGYVVARYQDDDGPWASISSFGYSSEKGVPPELNVAEPRLWRYPKAARWVTALSAGSGWRSTPWGEGDLEASFGIDLAETDINTYASMAYDSITGGKLGDDRTLSLRLLGDHTLAAGILRSALTLVEARHVEDLSDADPATYRQSFFSLGMEVEEPLGNGGTAWSRARVSVGASIDYSETPEAGGAPPREPIWAWGLRAGGTYALGDAGLLLSGGVSRRVRFPALRELYSGALGRFAVNPTLNPEVLAVAELGLTAHRGAAEAQVVGFYQRLSDAIVRISLGDGRLQRQNREVIRSLGVELLASYTWRSGVSLAGDVTLKDVDQEDRTAPAGQRNPEYQPWIAGGAVLSAPLALGIWGAGRLRHIGSRWCVAPDLERGVELSNDTWLDLEFGWGTNLGQAYSGSRLELLLAARNVTDAVSFDQCGIPQPGRLVQFQVRIF